MKRVVAMRGDRSPRLSRLDRWLVASVTVILLGLLGTVFVQPILERWRDDGTIDGVVGAPIKSPTERPPAGWGPDRRLFTIDNPAPYPAFNSIIDNPYVGDERNFMVTKAASELDTGGWLDRVQGEDGDRYLVRVYVENSAADNLAATQAGLIQGTRLKITSTEAPSRVHSLSAVLSADNVPSAWDSVSFVSDQAAQAEVDTSNDSSV